MRKNTHRGGWSAIFPPEISSICLPRRGRAFSLLPLAVDALVTRQLNSLTIPAVASPRVSTGIARQFLSTGRDRILPAVSRSARLQRIGGRPLSIRAMSSSTMSPICLKATSRAPAR